MRPSPSTISLLVLLLAAPTAAHGRAKDEGVASIAAIEAAIVAALGQPVGAPGGLARPVDPRLRLPACADSPAIIVQPRRVRVGCASRGWSFALDRKPASTRATPDGVPTVRQGEAVQLLIAGGGFAMRIVAIAMADGQPGTVIAVRRDDGGIIRARVVDAGTVTAVD